MTVRLDRRRFLGRAAATSVLLAVAPDLVRADDEEITADALRRAEQLTGLHFDGAERELMAESVQDHLDNLRAIVELNIANDVPPATTFLPLSQHPMSPDPLGRTREFKGISRALDPFAKQSPSVRPVDQLAFASVFELSHLLRKREITSVDLTKFFLERLKRLDEQLLCVVTFTEERALEQAAKADEEIGAGDWRGPLHGIPWGAKDLLAVKDYRTTWGATPFQDQVVDVDAEVVKRLDEAGAVLIAKTTVGALAWGDVWFGGTTKSPWNLEQGSSGSSAGSASAVAAGGLPFAIGTETLGSIVSPSSRCGATGLRPTHGRVPRTGCMALSWTMDKIGPITRSVEDAALVLWAIHGAHPGDPDARTAPWTHYSPDDLDGLRFGYDPASFEEEYEGAAFDQASLEVIRGLGINLTPITLPDLPVTDMIVVLEVEAAAAFDQLTRTNRDDELVRQVADAWPNVFRAAQLVPAVQYVQAQRARTLLQRAWEEMLGDLDGFVCSAFAGRSLYDTNLTGHPCVVLPNGFREDGTPTSITFIGRNHGEGQLVALAAAYQRATDFHLQHPEL